MVTTRRQSAAPAKAAPGLESNAASSRKRTRPTPGETPSRKSRRTDGDVTPIAQAAALPEVSALDQQQDVGEVQPFEIGPESGAVATKTSSKAKRRRSGKGKAAPSTHSSPDEDDEDVDVHVEVEASKKNATARATHVRFGSQEPVVEQVDVTHSVPTANDDDGEVEDVQQPEESDDEAPEDISATAAQRSNEAAEAEIAKALQQQRATKKRKRQEREAKLKEQSRSSKRKQNEVAAEEELVKITVDNIGQSEDDYLLNLLPDELLAEEFVRAPTPLPAPKQRIDIAAKAKPLNFDNDALKDVKAGPVIVRVLEKYNKLLPPKASSSKSLRESWLSGRRGRGGGFERKKVGGGFAKS